MSVRLLLGAVLFTLIPVTSMGSGTGATHPVQDGCVGDGSGQEPGGELPAAASIACRLGRERKRPVLCSVSLRDCQHKGLLIVDDKAFVLAGNCSGYRMLNADLGISEKGERLSINRAGVNRTFLALLQSLRDDPAGADKETVLGIPGQDGRTRLAMRLRLHGEAGHRPTVLLSIIDLQAALEVSRSTCSAIFGLSAREAEFAEHFSRGMRIEEIAPQMGCSPNTARAHLRSIFLKTGCSNQVELARIFAMVW